MGGVRRTHANIQQYAIIKYEYVPNFKYLRSTVLKLHVYQFCQIRSLSWEILEGQSRETSFFYGNWVILYKYHVPHFSQLSITLYITILKFQRAILSRVIGHPNLLVYRDTHKITSRKEYTFSLSDIFI